MTTVATTVACPECGTQVRISETARVNEIIECAACRSELEIMSLTPPMLALAPEIEEDWGE